LSGSQRSIKGYAPVEAESHLDTAAASQLEGVEYELDILDPSYQAKWTVNWHLHTNSKRRET